jgi:preprotein translocase subunit SecA
MAGRGSDILPDATALAAGGLHVILCQLNSSARIDRQFLGRAGRQGQPGSTERWIAADQEPLGSVPTVVLRTWMSNTSAASLSLTLFLRLLQVIRTYTDMQQRVNLLRGAESEERELAFTRNQPI